MTIGTPTTVTGITAAGTFTTSQSIAAGSTVIVVFAAGIADASFSSLTATDNATGGGNSYSLCISTPATSGVYGCGILVSFNIAHGLQNGGVITLAGTNASNAYPWSYAVTGINVFDKSGTDQSSTSVSTYSLSTGTLTYPNSLIFVYTDIATGSVSSWTEGSGFSTLDNPVGGNSAVSYDIVSSVTSVTYSPSWAPSAGYAASLATFGETSAPSCAGQLPMLGIGCSIGWTPALIGAGALRIAKALKDNKIITRRSLLIGHNGGPKL